MKTIILVFLLSVMAFGQTSKSNLTQQQKDIFGIEYVSRFDDLEAAIISMGVSEKILVIDTDQSITTDLTVPSNIVLEFKNGSILTCTDTLTINGYVNAGLYQIFSNTSKVDLSGSKNPEVYPQWFGAKSDSTDGLITANAFQYLVNSLKDSGKKLKIPNGTYLIASAGYYGIEFGDNANWEGESQDKTILSFQTNYVAIGQEAGYASDYDKNNVSFKNFTIKGNVDSINTTRVQSGIYIYWRTPDPMFKNVEISNITAENFNSGAITVSNTYNALVQNCRTNNTGYYGSASITVTGVKCRVLNNIIDKSQVGMELLASAIPSTLDTNYSFMVKGNLIEAEEVGISINQSDYADITDNHIYWVNITGKNDTTMYIGSIYTPSVALALWISNFKDLKIERNTFNGFTNHLQFTQSQKAYYDTTIYIGKTSIKDNYFANSGEKSITWNKTFYVTTKEIEIADNDFYRWYTKQEHGSNWTYPAIDLRYLPNVNIHDNTFYTEPLRSTLPMVLVSIDTLIVDNNKLTGVWLLSGTNSNVNVHNNNYPTDATYAYYDYTNSLQKKQQLRVYSGGVNIGGQLNTDSLFVDGFKLTAIRSYGSELATNGTFGSDVSSWTGQSSTLFHYDTDWNGISSTNLLLDSATNTVNIAFYQTIDTLELNAQYKISFDYFIPSGNDTVNAVILSLVKNFSPSAQKFYTPKGGLDDWTSATFTVTADALYNQIYFYQGQTTGSKYSTVGDKIYIDNISIKKILGSQETIDNVLIGSGFSLSSDSTTVTTGGLYFDSATGTVKRKY